MKGARKRQEGVTKKDRVEQRRKVRLGKVLERWIAAWPTFQSVVHVLGVHTSSAKKGGKKKNENFVLPPSFSHSLSWAIFFACFIIQLERLKTSSMPISIFHFSTFLLPLTEHKVHEQQEGNKHASFSSQRQSQWKHKGLGFCRKDQQTLLHFLKCNTQQQSSTTFPLLWRRQGAGLVWPNKDNPWSA